MRIILEGEGTRCLAEREGRFGALFADAMARGIVAGACKTASAGCATDDPSRNVSDLAVADGIPLLDGMAGHASLSDYISNGYELLLY